MDLGLLDLRKKMAREAATLLYYGIEKEYKQAKLKAAKIFRVSFLPSNMEVAIELDKIAEENEGFARKERLIRMREEALKIMKILKEHNPTLVGSVWRGTARQSSDIDITVYSDNPEEILKILKKAPFRIVGNEWIAVTKKGRKESSFHIYLTSPSKMKYEIIVRDSHKLNQKEKCEIYGDEIIGLNIQELEKILKENPTERFTPLKEI